MDLPPSEPDERQPLLMRIITIDVQLSQMAMVIEELEDMLDRFDAIPPNERWLAGTTAYHDRMESRIMEIVRAYAALALRRSQLEREHVEREAEPS